MFRTRTPDEYGITREAILARAGERRTKEALFAAACTELYARVLAELAQVYRDTADAYEMINGPRPDEDTETWDFDLLQMLGSVTPEMYRHHLSEHFPNLDMASLAIAGWVAKGMAHGFADKQGAFLAKFGVVKADWEAPAPAASYEATVVTFEKNPATGEDWTEQDLSLPVGETLDEPATREEVGAAWRQMAQATEVDQAEQAKMLGVSRSTVSNYGAGKTQAKCNAEQATYLANECRRRANALLAAAAVFERVR
jgi:predicted XRE-type DNA-binding protein